MVHQAHDVTSQATTVGLRIMGLVAPAVSAKVHGDHPIVFSQGVHDPKDFCFVFNEKCWPFFLKSG